MKVCVIGYGSIGKKHSVIIEKLGHKPICVSRHLKGENRVGAYDSVEECLRYHDLSHFVISNSTSDHLCTLRNLKEINKRYFAYCVVRDSRHISQGRIWSKSPGSE